MRIFELNTFCGTGSTGRIAADIADFAAQKGEQTIIGFGAGMPAPGTEVYALRIGGKLGRKWHGALRKLLDAEGYGSVLATRKLIRFLNEYKPDVIHLHNLHGCYVNHRILFRYLATAGIPVVWTLHDCWAFTGHCAYFDLVGCKRWQTVCHNCPQKAAYPVCVGVGGSQRNFRRKKKLFTSLNNLTLVTPCQWLAGLLPASFLKGISVRVVYNGVDRSTFRPVSSDLRVSYNIQERYIALAVASEWDERKGLLYLYALAGLLGAQYRVVVIGLSKAQLHDLPPQILGLERTADAAALARWYSTADCLVNPTMEDNMPLVNLEAMACGTPVVAFATGGCPEVIGDACGAVVARGDGAALAAAVKRIAPNKAALEAACLKQAERFDSVTSAGNYWALYRESMR
ncbi:MAG: glycosyltransferase [Eubacteriales bacterium]|nr:glycosyltransferase [Eubacteriales bacterium]